MKRKKEHQQNFKKILTNERLAPNRAILGMAMSMYMDSEGDREQDMCYAIIMSFVSGSKFQWADTANGDSADARGNAVDNTSAESYMDFLETIKKARESRNVINTQTLATNAKESANVSTISTS